MARILGIILAAALTAVLVPQGAAPVEAAGKKAAKKGTSASRTIYQSFLVDFANQGTGAPRLRRRRWAK